MSLYLNEESIFAIKLSVKVATYSTILVVLLGTPIAYFLARKEFKLKQVVELIIMLPIVFAPTVTGYILLIILGKHGIIGSLIYKLFGKTVLFTWYATIIASFIASFPLFVKTAQATFQNIDPEYINVSYTLGRGKLYTFFKIVLPLSRTGIIAGSMLAFARAFGEFGTTLMIAGNIPFKTNTIAIEIYNAVSSAQFERANFLVLISALVSLGMLFMVNKLLEKWSL